MNQKENQAEPMQNVSEKCTKLTDAELEQVTGGAQVDVQAGQDVLAGQAVRVELDELAKQDAQFVQVVRVVRGKTD